MATWTLGSVSEGTLRAQDLLPVFAQQLGECMKAAPERVPPEMHRAHLNLLADAVRVIDTGAWGDDGDARKFEFVCALIEELQTTINEYAPPFVMFGAHPDDPACVGWWPDNEAIEDAMESEGAVVWDDDTTLIPADAVAIRYVTDEKGNATVTVYDVKLEEAWSA